MSFPGLLTHSFSCRQSCFPHDLLYVEVNVAMIFPVYPFGHRRHGAATTTHPYPFCRGVRIGEKILHGLSGGFRRHLLHLHVPTERFGKERVKDLTALIVKVDAYPVAYGGFSDVWNCQLQQSPPERVAVKAVRPVISSDEEYQFKKQIFQQELRVWIDLEHQNILPLYGITNGFGQLPALVCPWAVNGTLSEYLEKFEAELDLSKRLRLLADIADGLQYLHSRNVVHGDLSGTNVLINESGRACLSDFGLSTLTEQISDTTVPGVAFPGNIRWAAPELFGESVEGTGSQLSTRKADVYSFGRVMLQTLTGKLPFHSIQRVAQIVIMISRGEELDRELGWDGKAIPDVLWSFVEECWASNPSKRPSSKEIAMFIKEQIAKL